MRRLGLALVLVVLGPAVGCGGSKTNAVHVLSGSLLAAIVSPDGAALSCDGPGDGTYLALFANTTTASTYALCTGKMEDIPPGGFQAVRSHLAGGSYTEKHEAVSGSLSLAGVTTDSVTGSFDLKLDNGAHAAGDFESERCATLKF